MSLPVLHRPRDVYYTLFLLSFLPAIILLDGQLLYPPSIIPTNLRLLHEWYQKTFNDVLVIGASAAAPQYLWFRFFVLNEVLFELPAGAYLLFLLRTKSPRAPAVAVVWATVCAFSTATCCYEYVYSPLMTVAQKQVLIALYGLYGIIFAVMAGDMFCRLQKTVVAAARLEGKREEFRKTR